MKTYRKLLYFEILTRRAFINITPKGDECQRESGMKEGIPVVNTKHIQLITSFYPFCGKVKY